MSTPIESPDRYALKSTTTNASNNPPSDHPQTLQSSHVDYGDFGPLAHVNTAESRVPAFGGEFQPGLYRSPKNRKVANPAPLGLCAFALSIFLLGCIQMKVRGISKPNILVGTAFAYGGLVQLLSGMWYVYFYVTSSVSLLHADDNGIGKWQLVTLSVPQYYLHMVVYGSLLESSIRRVGSTS